MAMILIFWMLQMPESIQIVCVFVRWLRKSLDTDLANAPISDLAMLARNGHMPFAICAILKPNLEPISVQLHGFSYDTQMSS